MGKAEAKRNDDGQGYNSQVFTILFRIHAVKKYVLKTYRPVY
jgi:hypothetical protein